MVFGVVRSDCGWSWRIADWQFFRHKALKQTCDWKLGQSAPSLLPPPS
jgi:hypothetical protein